MLPFTWFLIKIKLFSERLDLSKSAKYLGIKIDENLNQKDHFMLRQLSLTQQILCYIKLGNTLIFHLQATAIFETYLNYANLLWGQKLYFIIRSITLQWKAWRITNNQLRIVITVHCLRKAIYSTAWGKKFNWQWNTRNWTN